MTNWIQEADQQLSVILSEWSSVTTLIALAIAALLAYPIVFPAEPDTHPLLLARQSQPAPIRNKNESAAYRSPDTPHGYALRTGLGVKQPGAPRWASGRDGDLRDVWREVCKGGQPEQDNGTVPKGLIMTVLGKESVVEHDVDEITRHIAALGTHLKSTGIETVAIYLPNSLEYLITIFACAFYGLTPMLLPYNVPHQKVFELLNEVGADGLVCAAGSLPMDDLAEQCSSLRQLTWVVEKTSRHVDWNSAPSEKLKVSVWHDVVEQSGSIGELPGNQDGEKLGNVITVWQAPDPSVEPEIVTFTHGNIVAAVGALIASLPLRQRLGPEDLVLPADSFVHSYTLCWTLAALFSHASLAITSVASPGVDLALATRGLSPTVVIASVETMAKLHAEETKGINGGLQRLGMATSTQTMSAGRMPTDTLLFKLLAPGSASPQPGQLRLILTADRLGLSTPPLTSAALSDLRIFTRARICYALTAANVAGAIAQTNLFDYRVEPGSGHAHFGGILSSLEVKLDSASDADLNTMEPKGRITVQGPSVSQDVLVLKTNGRIRKDGCLQLA